MRVCRGSLRLPRLLAVDREAPSRTRRPMTVLAYLCLRWKNPDGADINHMTVNKVIIRDDEISCCCGRVCKREHWTLTVFCVEVSETLWPHYLNPATFYYGVRAVTAKPLFTRLHYIAERLMAMMVTQCFGFLVSYKAIHFYHKLADHFIRNTCSSRQHVAAARVKSFTASFKMEGTYDALS